MFLRDHRVIDFRVVSRSSDAAVGRGAADDHVLASGEHDTPLGDAIPLAEADEPDLEH